jgi:alkanesulfonate monooxygenase SsuD/methylene tetrahydromethanopterin reductase-like flavin-dependent oxidoreductase (luciferase family)
VDEATFDARPDAVHRARRFRDLPAAGRPRPRLSAAASSVADLRPLLEVVDDIVLPAWRFPDLETAADEARAEAVEAGRDPDSLGVAAVVPVSIGRTEAEAAVRADAEPLFARIGNPRDIGIFGTLEECQDRVIALAHAGISDLRCLLPATPDVHDVIAQLTAVAIGTTDVLVPGSLRSPAPPPPDGWGGRPERPPAQGVSGGSRRR